VTPGHHHLLLLDEADNVLLATRSLPAGSVVQSDGEPVTLAVDLALGHKVARRAIRPGEPILKYGVTIGLATQPIARGAHVHVHNIVSNYTRTHIIDPAETPGAGDGGPA
jgi:hypothetical protein